jgi:hypothetical protein
MTTANRRFGSFSNINILKSSSYLVGVVSKPDKLIFISKPKKKPACKNSPAFLSLTVILLDRCFKCYFERNIVVDKVIHKIVEKSSGTKFYIPVGTVDNKEIS